MSPVLKFSRNSYPKWRHFLKPEIYFPRTIHRFGYISVKFRHVVVGVSWEPQRPPENNGPFSQGLIPDMKLVGGLFVSTPLKKDAWQNGHYMHYVLAQLNRGWRWPRNDLKPPPSSQYLWCETRSPMKVIKPLHGGNPHLNEGTKRVNVRYLDLRKAVMRTKICTRHILP